MPEDIQKKAEEMRREYLRAWRKKHPEAVRKHNKNYWQRKALQKEEQKNAAE